MLAAPVPPEAPALTRSSRKEKLASRSGLASVQLDIRLSGHSLACAPQMADTFRPTEQVDGLPGVFMVKSEVDGPPEGALQRSINQIKAHPMIILAVAVVGVGGFMIKAEDVFVWGRDKVETVVNPHLAEYEALQTLDLDTRLEYFESNFGTAKAVYDLCEETLACPEEQGGDLRMYIHETDDLAVRAVFEDEQLEMYTYTLMSDKLSPELEWLDWTLGQLGETSFAEAIDEVEPVDEPTDSEIFMGPQAVAYAEVIAGGAPAQYRGMLLAHAPDGYSGPGTSFDTDAGFQIAEAQIQEQPPAPAVVERFRSSTTPNTFGEFRDDGGAVGVLLHEAQELIPLLFVGTEL